jgi:hypothetical protein
MPVYLVHGFRWPRDGFSGIRVHAVVHNLDDCSVEYIQNEHSRLAILESFRAAYPDIMKELEGPGRRLEFIEQYNPDDVEGPYVVSQPYAFVGDKVVMIAAEPGTTATTGFAGPGIAQSGGGGAASPRPGSAAAGRGTPPDLRKSPSQQQQQQKPRPPTQPMSQAAPFNSPADITALSVNVEEVIADGPGLTNKAWEALADLRDKIAGGEKIGWWVVYNGDPERTYDDEEEDEDEEDEEMEDFEGEQDTGVQEDERQQRPRQRPATSGGSSSAARALLDGTTSERPPVPPKTPQTMPTHRQASLTALPIRPSHPESTTRSEKGKQKDNIPEPGRLKDTAKSPSLRKRFFGRRP